MSSEIEVPETPKWLQELEAIISVNRGLEPRLSHEAGAGAACLKCGDKCPGGISGISFGIYRLLLGDSTYGCILLLDGMCSLVFSVVGLFGTYKEDYRILMWYAIAHVIFFLFAIVAGICLIVNSNKTRVSGHLRDLYKHRTDSNTTDEAISGIHKEFSCCGLYGPSGEEVKETNGIIWSCCPLSKYPCEPCEIKNAYSKGCVSALSEQRILGGVTTMIGSLFYVLVVLLPIFLAKKIRVRDKGEFD